MTTGILGYIVTLDCEVLSSNHWHSFSGPLQACIHAQWPYCFWLQHSIMVTLKIILQFRVAVWACDSVVHGGLAAMDLWGASVV